MSTLNTYNLKSPDSANTNLALDASGNVAIQAGSASTPSVYVTGDANTGLYSPGADQIAVATGGTARLYIDASGRVGIGTPSPSAIVHANSGSASDVYFRSSNSLATSSLGTAADGSTYVYNSAAYPVTFSTNATERARIDSSGRLLIGTSSTSQTSSIVVQGNNSSSVDEAVIRMANGSSTPGVGAYLGNLIFTDSGHQTAAFIGAMRDGGTWSASSKPSRLVFSTTADGASSPTERMRITNGGDVFIGTTTAGLTNTTGFGFNNTTSSSSYLNIGHTSPSTSGQEYLGFSYGGSQIGSIRQSGTTAVTYNTTSDYRLKENLTPIANAISRLTSIPTYRFNFISEPERIVDGFVAHEVQAVVPEAVTGEKDAVDTDGNPIYQGIDQSKLVPLLTAALQEAIGEIESLKARVAALESA